MPLCTISLLAFKSSSSPLPAFIAALKTHNITPLVISRVIRWIILPTKISTESLLARNIHWDIVLILPSSTTLPESITNLIKHQWTVTAGVPSRLLKDFSERNAKLLSPQTEIPSSVAQKQQAEPHQMSDSAQNLELSEELNAWIDAFYASPEKRGRGPVSMLNLLSFKPGMKASYLEYGKAFAESVGSRHGGNAKIVGTVTGINGMERKIKSEEDDIVGEWDEVALAHYPSIAHFRDMLASEDYQKVNKKFRVPALRDTFILMTSEIGVLDDLEGVNGLKGKL